MNTEHLNTLVSEAERIVEENRKVLRYMQDRLEDYQSLPKERKSPFGDAFYANIEEGIKQMEQYISSLEGSLDTH